MIADLVPRPALAARVAGALDDGAVELVAPAGYGKTVALQQALERRGGDVAWLLCTPADRDPGRLLVHLLDVLRGAVPGLGAVLGVALAASPWLAPAAAPTRAEGLASTLLDPLDPELRAGLVELERRARARAGLPRRARAAGALPRRAARPRHPAHREGPPPAGAGAAARPLRGRAAAGAPGRRQPFEPLGGNLAVDQATGLWGGLDCLVRETQPSGFVYDICAPRDPSAVASSGVLAAGSYEFYVDAIASTSGGGAAAAADVTLTLGPW